MHWANLRPSFCCSGLLLAAAWVFLLRYLPDDVVYGPSWFTPIHSDPLNGFAQAAAIVLAFLPVFGLVGGWILAGRMLAALTRITDATRMAPTGSLSHRISPKELAVLYRI